MVDFGAVFEPGPAQVAPSDAPFTPYQAASDGLRSTAVFHPLPTLRPE